jgi:HD-GYP domain-containing protein (c-di-GMP phosphodiesterase class II)
MQHISTPREIARALSRAYSYNPVANLNVLFGILWGSVFPLFLLATHWANADGTARLGQLMGQLLDSGWGQVSLALPVVFGVLLGAMGTLRKDRDDEIGQSFRDLEAKLNDRVQELKETNEQAVKALSRAIEAKDPYTHGHSSRVWGYARVAAEQLSLSVDQLTRLRLACYLHDVGKIRIPGRILNKPGPLTAEEFEIIKFHPLYSERIVSAIDAFCYVAGTIRHHHERMDGRGYPDGLTGENIPLLSRIMSVADALDAMTSDRPYRPALTEPAAAEELKRCSSLPFNDRMVPNKDSEPCRQFDPKVVTAMLRGLEQSSIEQSGRWECTTEDVVIDRFMESN